MKTAQTKKTAIASSVAALVAAQAIDGASVSTKSLGAKVRSNAAQNEKFGNIGDTLAQVGDALGHYTAEKELTASEIQAEIERLLREAIKFGLTAEDLKAPSKASPQECYVVLVDALNAPRIACGLEELSKGTRDNYLSRIRNFVRDRGTMPLDLHGNAAKKAAKKGKDEGKDEGEGDAPQDKPATSVQVKREGIVAFADAITALRNEFTADEAIPELLMNMLAELQKTAKAAAQGAIDAQRGIQSGKVESAGHGKPVQVVAAFDGADVEKAKAAFVKAKAK